MRAMSLRGAAVAAAAALLPIIAAALPSPAAAQAEQKVPSIELRGELSPAQADWIGHALGDAADAGAPFAIVRLDTPGGVDSAAEEIVDQIRSAPIPVVVYVYPGGAEVKDQGASIVDAGDVAAMAPGTTLESEGNGLGENTALKQGRIEMIASDQEKLLEELDGYEVSGPKSERLSTAGTEIDDQGMTIPFQLLEVLVDPNVVLLLLLIGILGLALEAFAPGTIIPRRRRRGRARARPDRPAGLRRRERGERDLAGARDRGRGDVRAGDRARRQGVAGPARPGADPRPGIESGSWWHWESSRRWSSSACSSSRLRSGSSASTSAASSSGSAG